MGEVLPASFFERQVRAAPAKFGFLGFERGDAGFEGGDLLPLHFGEESSDVLAGHRNGPAGEGGLDLCGAQFTGVETRFEDAALQGFVSARGGAMAQTEENFALTFLIMLKPGLTNRVAPGLAVTVGADGAILRVGEDEVDGFVDGGFGVGAEVESADETVAAREPFLFAALGKDDAVEDAAVRVLYGEGSASGLIEGGQCDGGFEGFFLEVEGQQATRGKAFFIDD